MALPSCDHFSYDIVSEGLYKHFCSISGAPEEVIRGLECARCSKNKNVIVPVGYIQFRYNQGETEYMEFFYSDLEKEMNSREIVGDIFSGKEFFQYADEGRIINYDGQMSKVYLNNCLSNLGLAHKGISQGEFMVDGQTWLKICEEFDVKVEWCNK